jgi:hypothetical protein
LSEAEKALRAKNKLREAEIRKEEIKQLTVGEKGP